jgi:hypothetical protein
MHTAARTTTRTTTILLLYFHGRLLRRILHRMRAIRALILILRISIRASARISSGSGSGLRSWKEAVQFRLLLCGQAAEFDGARAAAGAGALHLRPEAIRRAELLLKARRMIRR